MTQSLPGRHPAPERAPAGRGELPVVVVGAGPYGLSVAAHLRAAGVPVHIFGEVMGSWRHAMATGMFLKSTPAATDLSAPGPGARLADFQPAPGRAGTDRADADPVRRVRAVRAVVPEAVRR
ncbi:hypothetical protein ACQ4WX_07420 [Streptomyces lasalocidi]